MKHHPLHQFTACLLLLLLPGHFLRAAEPLHVVLSSNGSAIQGDGPNNVIVALGLDHEVAVESTPTGGTRRVHKPLRIVKTIDKTTPLLYKALANNEVITAEFRLRRPGPNNGPVATYYTVSISNARVTGVRDWKTNTRDISADRAGDLEEVSFTYQTITWTWVDGGITHTDTWNSQQ